MLALREGVSCVCTFTAWITVGISTTRMRNLGFTIGPVIKRQILI